VDSWAAPYSARHWVVATVEALAAVVLVVAASAEVAAALVVAVHLVAGSEATFILQLRP